jgi:hypothetical protein
MRHYVANESINDNENSRIECYMLRSEIGEQRTLNQRVQGSSPCAPTIEIKNLVGILAGRASQKSRLGSDM